MSEPGGRPEDAADYNPRHARSEEAGETPPHADAERMEAAMREHGPLVTDADTEARRRLQPTEDGPGTSLT
jgi:hypothetical protein